MMAAVDYGAGPRCDVLGELASIMNKMQKKQEETVSSIIELGKKQDETTRLIYELMKRMDLPTSARSSLEVLCTDDSLDLTGASAVAQESELTTLREAPTPLRAGMRKSIIQQLVEEATEIETFPSLPRCHDIGAFGWLSTICSRIVASRRFDHMIGIVIAANAICIGVETQMQIDGQNENPLRDVEHIFISIYIVELAMRLLAHGRKCWYDGWFSFDFALVVTGVVSSWIIQPLYYQASAGSQLFEQLFVFRTCRLLRLIRAFRMIEQFEHMWRLFYGLLTSFSTMVSTLSLVALILYIFSILGVELITKDSYAFNTPELQDIVNTNFSSLLVTMLFLVQFVTLDGVANIYFPLIIAKPLLIIYFLPLILVVSIAIMNLVMAKIVEGAFEAAHGDREMEKRHKKKRIRKMIPRLARLFTCLDEDNSGFISIEELLAIDLSSLPKELVEHVTLENMQELFEILDVDGSGQASQDEFIEGILSLCITEIPLEWIEMLKLLRVLREKVAVVNGNVRAVQTQLVQSRLHGKTINCTAAAAREVEAAVAVKPLQTI